MRISDWSSDVCSSDLPGKLGLSARATRHSWPLQIILQCSKQRKHSPMGIIGSSIKPFSATSYHQGKFVPVTDADVAGKWAVFFFYPADFTFVCPTELEDLAAQYEPLQGLGVDRSEERRGGKEWV